MRFSSNITKLINIAQLNGAAKRRSGFIFPFREFFVSFGNKKNSRGLRSRKYSGWLTTLTFSDEKKSLNIQTC